MHQWHPNLFHSTFKFLAPRATRRSRDTSTRQTRCSWCVVYYCTWPTQNVPRGPGLKCFDSNHTKFLYATRSWNHIYMYQNLRVISYDEFPAGHASIYFRLISISVTGDADNIYEYILSKHPQCDDGCDTSLFRFVSFNNTTYIYKLARRDMFVCRAFPTTLL